MTKGDMLHKVDKVLDRCGGLWRSIPEDRIEGRTDWSDMEDYATQFYWVLEEVLDYLKREE